VEALAPWPLKLILDNVLGGGALPTQGVWIGQLPGAQSVVGLLGWLVAATVVLFLAVRVVELCKGILQTRVTGRMKYALGAAAFARLQDLSLIYHRKARRGDLLRRVTSDTDCLPTLVAGAAVPAVTSVLALIVLFGIMWYLHSLLALVALIIAIPMFALIWLLGPRMTDRAYEQQQAEGEIWSVAEQALSSLPVVQAFGREEHEGRRFSGVAVRTVRAYLQTALTQLQFKLGVDGSQALGVSLIVLIGGLQVLGGSLTVGTLVVFLSYLTALYAPLVHLAYMSSTVALATANAKRIGEVLSARDVLPERVDAHPIARGAPGHAGHIRLEGVVFGYDRGHAVLRGVDLDVPPGQVVAFVGPSGAGKTSLASLIARLFDPWEGRVLLDGRDLRTITLASLRAQIGMVLQDPFLLPISVADNIAYGRPQAARDEIVAAAVAANADAFIRELPRRYDTIIGERGVTLSGGQRQRIAIARALLKDPSVLILDEPTSALDAQTESAVLGAMRELMRGRTTLIIAHRPSTIRSADRIAVLDDGHIVEVGNHRALIEAGGPYGRLFSQYIEYDRPIRSVDADA